VRVEWPEGVIVPVGLESLAQSVLTEAMRNVVKHADPTCVEVSVGLNDETFTLEIRNDGVRADGRGSGMGLRLSAFEALQHGGVVEFGPCPGECWRVRLVVARAHAEA
jgi:signal transduction histidine kinase